MKKKDLQVSQEKLLTMRETVKSKLFGEGVFGLDVQKGSGAIQSTPSHIGDLGTDIFDHDLQLNLASNESDLLTLVEDALARIEEGQYGVYLSCEEKIHTQRLLAIPYVANYVPCQEKREEQL